jgi:hypothetical protein
MMLGWLRGHPQSAVAHALDDEEHYVAQGFAFFWQAMARSKDLACLDFAAALGLLRASMHGALLDALRAEARAKRVPLPTSADSAAPLKQIRRDGRAVWEVIQRLLPNEREQRAA